MQFPVPQFTDVEDRIIGPLTLKQFGIVFAAGIVVFLGYSATKSIIVLIFLSILFGLPALFLAFGKTNGRPIYNSMGFYLKFLTSNKELVFHKETSSGGNTRGLKDAEMQSKNTAAAPPPETQESAQKHLREVQALLNKTAAQERQILGK